LLFQGNAVMGCDYFNCFKHIYMRCGVSEKSC
jgi:hypothetical protein